jgi:3-hydroxybutyryl-CoA dehydrogenase
MTTIYDERSSVAVLGFGTMGSGIAQVCAQGGRRVLVLESSQEQLDHGFELMREFLDGGIERGKLDEAQRDAVIGRVSGHLDPAELASVGLVIEAVIEDLTAKTALLGQVSAVVSETTVIASNTSALSLTQLASGVRRPERFAGLHFFNPVPVMKLVEVVAALQTEPDTLATLESFVASIGKVSITTKDRPGFLVNRLLMPYLNQVAQAYDDEIATLEDIDTAVELGLGYPMGGLKLLDLIGLDTHLHATSAAYEQNHDAHFAPPPLLQRMVEAGYLGRKASRGFYERSGQS